ncbi:hypothetical protein [Rhodococcoides fascians]|uniref:hypothetical protein n=1 Tax=Rhodococcoides fascians TaxID=1828 RepID=UPI0027842421|nr:hypothetical protein [Rhodococcus fascians]MDQ0284737.1 hypothetical protein [Rhodococcus fascians]
MRGHPEAIIDSGGFAYTWDGLAPFLVPVAIFWAFVTLDQIATKISRTRHQRRRSDLETAHEQAAPVGTSR